MALMQHRTTVCGDRLRRGPLCSSFCPWRASQVRGPLGRNLPELRKSSTIVEGLRRHVIELLLRHDRRCRALEVRRPNVAFELHLTRDRPHTHPDRKQGDRRHRPGRRLQPPLSQRNDPRQTLARSANNGGIGRRRRFLDRELPRHR
ncbi:MAG: hypothetical protein JRE45_04835 [Deltaproteobacteria bacterium]|nr:hypothetical protein [Deltaproteobacteria bacterium]